MKNITKEQIKQAVENTKTAAEASKFLNVSYYTFRKYAKQYDLFITNKAGKGIIKKKCSLEDIKHKQNVKKRIFNLNLKPKACEICGISNWIDKPITLEIHHINGINNDNRIENIQILCPNCHSQTNNFRNKRRVPLEKSKE